MAMTKIKQEGKRKVVKSFSIQTDVVNNFASICERKDVVPSHVIQRLMEDFIKDNGK